MTLKRSFLSKGLLAIQQQTTSRILFHTMTKHNKKVDFITYLQ